METAIAKNQRRPLGDYVGRSQKGPLGQWFWEIDRVLLLLVTILISIGLIAVAAASPAAAERYSGDTLQFQQLHYFYRQLIWLGIGIPLMFVISTMPKEFAKRFALAGAVCFFMLLLLVPIIGNEVNGARRWLGYGVATFQPSEFLKPFFIVATAWLLSLRVTQDPTLPVVGATAILTGIVALFLMRQPDFGLDRDADDFGPIDQDSRRADFARCRMFCGGLFFLSGGNDSGQQFPLCGGRHIPSRKCPADAY